MSGYDVNVALGVPEGVDCFEYSERVNDRAAGLGFPDPWDQKVYHLVGAPAVADLSWSVADDPDLIAGVVSALRSEFDVWNVLVDREAA